MSIGFSILLDSLNYIFDIHRIINLANGAKIRYAHSKLFG